MTHVIGDTSHFTRDMIFKALDTDDPVALVRVLTELGNAGEERAAELQYADAVAEHLYKKDESVIASAATALGNFGSQGLAKGGKRLAELSLHPSPMVRIAAIESLGNIGPLAKQHAHTVATLVKDDREPVVRVVALHALGDMEAHSEASVVAAALEDSCPEVVSAACDTLSLLGQVAEGIGSSLAARLGDGRTRYSALAALVDLGDKAPANCAAGVADCLGDADGATRSMAVAAAEAGVPCSFPRVLELLRDPRPGTRSAAAVALGSPSITEEAGAAHAEAIACLLDDPAEDDSQLPLLLGGGCRRLPAYMRRPQCAAVVTLGKLCAVRYSSDIAALLGHPHYEVRCCALEALGEMGSEGQEFVAEIAALLTDGLFPVRAKACEVLGLLGLSQELEGLVGALRDSSDSVREAAATAAGALGEVALDRAGGPLVELLGDDVPNVRVSAVAALPLLGESAQGYAGVIAALLQDEVAEVRIAVLQALPKMGDHGAALAEDMADHMFEEAPGVREAAKEAMRQLGDVGEPFLQCAPDE